nr:exodeoxyribonuclease VII small subunit [Candidatus Krumholzibacteria bacterium]
MAEKSPKKTLAKKLSFAEAVSEVEGILSDLESDAVDIDTLGEEVKRAVELIQVCRDKLEKTDSEVRGLVAGLEKSAGPEDAAPATDQRDNPDEDLPF